MRSRFFVSLLFSLVAVGLEPDPLNRKPPLEMVATFRISCSLCTKVPAGVILVKGAWSSASDSVTRCARKRDA